MIGVAVLVSAVACAIGNGPPVVVEGQRFPLEQAKGLKPGTPQEQVRLALGAPFQVITDGSTERWKYYDRERRDEALLLNGRCVKVLSRTFYVAEVVITFSDGLVQSVSHSERQES
jgi:outer membrane protein assembly factor BamE (lipoprotein component of BamABCDE complex)